ncbi:uncharacterized protein CCOS01_10650 [Colletotrichum costaricense]|uniref:Uncharacterized protein n=1 Tax=Colletotrichum costaricense TaxID=1209916 RepID=A0AAI9YRL1_9PEZI|nr:uncharacterized protein CCOS01_10650 [Colletotrichum costaricense]KAK1520531.1 hypothetical protein CCOS01_10650 [Colletotrichum costaricense]
MYHYAGDVDLLTSDFHRPTSALQTQYGQPPPSPPTGTHKHSTTGIHKQSKSPTSPPTPPESMIQWKAYRVPKPKLSGSEESVLSQDQVCSLTFSGTESKTDLSSSSFSQRDCDCQLVAVSPLATHFCQQTQLPRPCPVFSENRPSNYPSDPTQLLIKLEALEINQKAQSSQLQLCDGSDEAEDLEMVSLDGFGWEASDSFKDFQQDPAHNFWRWDEAIQQWTHQDEDTKSVIYCPVELD